MSIASKLGYAANAGFHNNDILTAFSSAAGVRQAGNPLDAAFHGEMSAMARVSGKSFVSNLPMGQMKAVSVQSYNNIGDLQGMRASAEASKEQVQRVATDFKNEVQQVQKTMDAAMEQAAENLGMDLRQCQSSIKPPYKTGHVESGATLAVDMMTPGSVAIYAAMAQAYSEMRQERTKLTPEQETRLLDEMRVLMSPKLDEMGNVVAPAEIPSQYNMAELSNEDMKQLYMPAELQPEGQQIFGALHALDNHIIPHLEHAEAHEFDNEGNKLQAALEQGPETVAQFVGDEAVAGRIMDAVDEGQSLQVAMDQGSSLPPAVEIEYNSKEFFGSLAMPSSETPAISEAVKDAIASYNNEFKIRPDLENDMSFTNGAAA